MEANQQTAPDALHEVDVESTTKTETTPKTLSSHVKRAIRWFIKDQWFLIGAAIVVIVASQVQVPAGQQAIKQVVVSYLSVSVIFFITGCTLDTTALLQNYSKWRHHIFIQLQSFLVVSALAYAVVSLTALNPNFMDPWLLIGLIFNGCQPTAIASNVLFTRQSHGNVALTVVETTIGNFLGPFLSPVLIRMYLLSGAWYTRVVPPQSGGYAALYRRVFMQLGLSIYLPMVVGQLVRWAFPKATHKVFVTWRIGKFGAVSLLFLLWQTFDHAFATGAFHAVKASNLVYIVFIAIVNYFLWLIVSVVTARLWMERADVVSVAMCVSAKTLALSVPLSFLLFVDISALDEAKIQIPVVIFQILQIGLASLSTVGFRRWVEAGRRREK